MTEPIHLMQITHNRKTLLCLCIIIVYVLLVFLPIFINTGPLLQTDQPMWTALAEVFKNNIFPSQKWFWGVMNERVGAGQVMNRTYSMPTLLPWCFQTFVNASMAIKLSMLTSTMFFLVSFFLISQKYMPPKYALASSFVILTSIFDNLVSGMWYNYLSLGFAFSFWLSSESFIKHGKPVYIICSVISLALSVYSHPVGVLLCITIWASYFLIHVLRKDKKFHTLFFLAAIPLISVLLSAPQLYALLNIGVDTSQVSSNASVSELTGFLELIRRMFFIRVWGATLMTNTKSFFMVANIFSLFILFVVGLYCSYKKNKHNFFQLIMIIIVTFIMISKIFNFIGLHNGIFSMLDAYYDRFQLYSNIYLVIGSGAGLYYIAENIDKVQRKRIAFSVFFWILLINFCMIAVRTPKKIFFDQTEQFGSLQTTHLREDFKYIWDWINRNVNFKAERIYFEDSYGKIKWNLSEQPESKKTHIMALSSIYTEIMQVGGWCGWHSSFADKYEQGTLLGLNLKDFSESRILHKMKQLNCKYIVIYTDKLIAEFMQYKFLYLVAQFKSCSIFEAITINPAWAFKEKDGSNINYLIKTPTEHEMRVTGEVGEKINIAYSYSPRWKAFSAGRSVPIYNNNSMMQVLLPANGQQFIEIQYIINQKCPLIMLYIGIFFSLLYYVVVKFILSRRNII